MQSNVLFNAPPASKKRPPSKSVSGYVYVPEPKYTLQEISQDVFI